MTQYGSKGIRAFKTLERRFKKPHPALEGYREPHPSMMWLVDAFFTLHRRRNYSSMGHPESIKLSEAEDYNRVFLQLPPTLSTLYFRTVLETDEAIREYLFKVSSDKLEEDKKAAKSGHRGRKDHGRVQR